MADNSRTAIIVAIIGLTGVLCAAIITNIDKLASIGSQRNANNINTAISISSPSPSTSTNVNGTKTEVSRPNQETSYGEGVIRGTISFAGDPPAPISIDLSADPWCAASHPNAVLEDVVIANGKLADVFIYVKSNLLDTFTYQPAPSPAVLEHRGCQFVPRIVGLQIGQTLKVRNADSTQHNTNVQSTNNPAWNVFHPPGNAPMENRFERPEMFIRVKDNQHPWQRAFIVVLTYPFFSTSNREGAYKITGLPPGEYTVVAWHEKYGEQTADRSVGVKEAKQVDFTFSAHGK